MPKKVPQRSHIGRRKGIYCYRRRLPGTVRGELCLSLRTCDFREAEHRAAILDARFSDALQRARQNVTEAADLNKLLREYLQEFLDGDLQRRIERPPGSAVYAHWWQPGDPETAQEADLWAIRNARQSLAHDLATNSPAEMGEYAGQLVREHGLPAHLLGPLTYGLIEAAIRGWEVVERRTLGTEPLVFGSETDPRAPSATATDGGAIVSPARTSPVASTMVEAFGEWGQKSGGWRPGAESQAKVSLGLFLEVCGDRPIDAYTRADGDRFRTALRALPTTYRKSPRDRNRTIKEIIAEADLKNVPRISDKTVKRHFWAVSRFFAYLIETGYLPRDAENPGRGFTFNTKGVARRGREMWSGEELRKLFASPVWTGCHPFFRSRVGTEVIRDALFWLPLLGLFHGNRLEEFAQLRRGDVAQSDGVWFLAITDEGGRQLKNEQSRRRVPLHSELIRTGFLDYVAGTAPQPQDQVFPELKPGGKDRKLGYYFSKEFSTYRQSIGVRRPGLDYHSFRPGVTTKLFEADVSEGWIDLLTGHESGGESRRRYLKGIPLPQLRGAIERVTWPEVDLSGLYVREAGDDGWRPAATIAPDDAGSSACPQDVHSATTAH